MYQLTNTSRIEQILPPAIKFEMGPNDEASCQIKIMIEVFISDSGTDQDRQISDIGNFVQIMPLDRIASESPSYNDSVGAEKL